ncbi:MAG TPA: hypothetical protein VK131_05365 [Candidatus Acidoferrales bacterium]|nr:hypothetical protein [Candidatus Acidoferrales bacterium]
MASIAFAIPRREGSEDHSKELVQALTGERGDEVHKRRLQHGFDRIKVWHQDEPRISIVYMEADDLQAAFRNVASDDHEQVKWVSDMIQKITGHHPTDHAGRPASRLVLDWHREKGHSATHH